MRKNGHLNGAQMVPMLAKNGVKIMRLTMYMCEIIHDYSLLQDFEADFL